MSAITHVTVSRHISSSNPILPIIRVQDVIVDGTGTIEETLQGGQVHIAVTLTAGRSVAPLKAGEIVYLRAEENGQALLLSALITEKSHEPWQFLRVTGSTG